MKISSLKRVFLLAAVVLTAGVSVPEPSTLALLVMGAIGIIAWAWRRRKANVLNIKYLTFGIFGLGTILGGGWQADTSAAMIQWAGNGHYYEAISVPQGITWIDAQSAAQARGGYLATITSSAENDFAFSLVDSPEFWNYASWTMGPWLGGYQDKLAPDYSEPAGGWRWVTTEPFIYTNWSPLNPNNDPDENYLHFTGDYGGPRSNTWNDATSNGTGQGVHGYVIESSVPEPSTLVLLGMGALLLLAYVWRLQRRKAICSVLLLSVLFFTASPLLADTAVFDFNSGIGPNFSVFNESGLFNVTTEGPEIRIFKPADNGTVSPLSVAAGIHSNFSVVGNFSITVDFALTDFPLPNHSRGLNESLLSVSGIQTLVEILRFTYPTAGNQIEVFSFPSGSPIGGMSSSLMSGRYQLQRSGSVITASFADPGSSSFTQLGSVDGFPDPMSIQLFAVQNQDDANGSPRSTTSLDISFDNLTVVADQIQGIPEPSTFVLLAAGAFGLLVMAWRRRKRAA